MKKILYTIKILSLAAVGMLTASCDNWLDINTDPNNVANPPINTIMASATADIGFRMGSDIHRYGSIFVQQFTGGTGTGVQTVDIARYTITETDVNNVWRTGFYGGGLADVEQVIALAGVDNPKYSGVAKILKAFNFSVIVDAWGDVPYDDALKFAGNFKPLYDESSTIYPKLISLIDEGIANLGQPSVLVPGADDLVYGGDLEKWERLGNAIKLRLYVHYYPTNNATAAAGINALVAANKLLRNNADNFQVAFVNEADRFNAIDQFERRRQNQFWPTTTFVNLMNSKADPRRPFYLRQLAGGAYAGFAPGNTATGLPNASRMHVFIRGAVTNEADPVNGYAGDTPQRILCFAEQNFILAEHFFRSSDLSAAQTYYEAGIRASMTLAGVSDADAKAYIDEKPLLVATALRQIIEEKYVANFGVAVEPWTDWRRTGFPVLIPVAGAATPNIPRILPYSDQERVTNRENTPERADITKPSVFWDPGL